MSKATRYVGLFAAVGLLASGCSGAGGSGGAGAAECAPAETEMSVGVHTEVRGFDVVNGGSVGVAGGAERAAVFDTLMEYDAEAGEYVPRMAESFEPNADFTQWTLTLRDGMTFASGNPVTTEAVEFSVERHGAEDTVSLFRPQMDQITKMDVVSPLKMVFHLDAPRGDFPAVFASSPGMLADPAVFEEKGAEEFGLDPGAGAAGPYAVESYTPGEEVVLTKRDDYWGEGDYCIGTLRFVFVEDEQARRDAFLNGELDLAILNSASIVDDVRQQGFDMHTSISYGDTTTLINHGTGGGDRPGEDLRVRQAVAYALDPEAIDERATGGTGMPSSAIVTDDSPLWTEEIEGPAYDPDEASRLLEEAKADGYDGKITLSCDNTQQHVEWAIAVEAMLESVGFEVELDNSRSITDHVVNVFYTGNYDLACFAMSVDDTQAWATFQTTLGQDEVTQSRVGYSSEAMTEAMNALRSAGTEEERQAAMVEIQEVWNAEIPMAITTHAERGAAWQDHVEGLRFMNTAIPLFDDARMAN